MAAIDKLMQYMYFQDRLDARREAREEKSLTRALSEFTKEASYKVTTAGELEKLADEQTDVNVLNQLMQEVDTLKTGVKYVDDLLDTNKKQIGIKVGAVNSYNAIDSNIDKMMAKINVGDKEATEGFLSAIQDHKKNLSGITANLTANQESILEEEIGRAEKNYEFINRISRFDTDVATGDIDWEQTGEREVVDPEGVKSMQPTYAHDTHTRTYLEKIVAPEIDVAKETGDYELVNKLLALAPSNIRTEKLKIAGDQKKFYDEQDAEMRETDQRKAFGKANFDLDISQKALSALFKESGDSNIESLLQHTTTELGGFSGMGDKAIAALPVDEAVKSIENSIQLLMDIHFIEGPLKDIGGDFDPLVPAHRQFMDTYLAQFYNETKDPNIKGAGIKVNSTFGKKTRTRKTGAAWRSVLGGYVRARRELLNAVDRNVWYYPHMTPDEDDNPF